MGEGVKYDNDKPRWGLLPYKQVEEVVDVLTSGSKKYADDNWKKLPNAHERYFDAMLRHISQYRYGDKLDDETKKSHLAHAICCALFMMWFDDQPEEETMTVENSTVFGDVVLDDVLGMPKGTYDSMIMGNPKYPLNNRLIGDGSGQKLPDADDLCKLGECSLTTEPNMKVLQETANRIVENIEKKLQGDCDELDELKDDCILNVNDLLQEPIDVNSLKTENNITFSGDKSNFSTIDEMISKLQYCVDRGNPLVDCTTVVTQNPDDYQYVYHGKECEMFMFVLIDCDDGSNRFQVARL